MNDVFPITFSMMILFLGILLRSTNLLKQEDADIFLKIIFYVSLPALILNAITAIDINQKSFLPIISSVLIIITFVVTSLLINFRI